MALRQMRRAQTKLAYEVGVRTSAEIHHFAPYPYSSPQMRLNYTFQLYRVTTKIPQLWAAFESSKAF